MIGWALGFAAKFWAKVVVVSALCASEASRLKVNHLGVFSISFIIQIRNQCPNRHAQGVGNWFLEESPGVAPCIEYLGGMDPEYIAQSRPSGMLWH